MWVHASLLPPSQHWLRHDSNCLHLDLEVTATFIRKRRFLRRGLAPFERNRSWPPARIHLCFNAALHVRVCYLATGLMELQVLPVVMITPYLSIAEPDVAKCRGVSVLKAYARLAIPADGQNHPLLAERHGDMVDSGLLAYLDLDELEAAVPSPAGAEMLGDKGLQYLPLLVSGVVTHVPGPFFYAIR